jgi:uncharacterized membrane protein (UPF0127 family)
MGKSVSPSKWTSTIRIALVSVAVSFGLVCAICFNDIVPTIGGISFSSGAQLDSVLVANSVRSNSRGLMHQTELNRNEGMLFLLPEMSTEHRFWMKDTPIPLDIVYLDDQWQVVAHDSMAPCTKDPCVLYKSPKPYQFALELASGWVKDFGINIGERVTFTPLPVLERLQLLFM